MRAAATLLSLAATAGAALVGEPHSWSYNGVQHNARLNGVQPTICETTPGVQQHSGRFEIDNATKAYFYWAIQSRTMKEDAPTILWMTGGPGCSSSLALLFENGPCHVAKDGSTYLNPDSWNTHANLIYIDQPAGVGFSTGIEDDKNEAMVREDMYQFLQAFFTAFPEWNSEFYVFGESYGGHYAPSTASRVFEGMQNGEGVKINLKGLAVGNGLTDPEIQYKYYPQMAYNWSIEVQGHPVISEEDYVKWSDYVPTCVDLIKKCNAKGASEESCDYAKDQCNNVLFNPYYETGLNPYDITKECVEQPLCYNFDAINAFMNSEAVQTNIGVTPMIQWSSCNNEVNGNFKADWMAEIQGYIPEMLEGGVRVLIYAGDVDFVCNWLGNKAWTLDLPWSGKDAFNAAGDNKWNGAGTGEGKGAGHLRTAKGFSFLQVFGAGHMVPYDKPQDAAEMVKQFVVDKAF